MLNVHITLYTVYVTGLPRALCTPVQCTTYSYKNTVLVWVLLTIIGTIAQWISIAHTYCIT